MRRLLIIVLTAVPILGCTTEEMRAYTPVKEKTRMSEDVLLTAARRSLDANRFVAIEKSEPYSLTTREKEVFTSSVPRLAYRYTFDIMTEGGWRSEHQRDLRAEQRHEP